MKTEDREEFWEEWSERTEEPTREEWLEQAVAALEPGFRACHARIRNVRVSVGLPVAGARPGPNQVLAQAWPPDATNDDTPQIFIHPSLTDKAEVLAQLVRCLCHVYSGDYGHMGEFRALASAMGLHTPYAAVNAHTSKTLSSALHRLGIHLGTYPHAKLNLQSRKKQATRMFKASCPTCGYLIRLTSSWAAMGLPVCPLDAATFVLEAKNGA
jgi:hypothetical protein